MELLPLFLNLTGRAVLLVGGGRVAEGKLQQLLAAGAIVRVVAPEISASIRAAGVELVERGFVAADLDGMWLVVAAAGPEVNRAVADAATERRIFVNAVDDPANASAFLSGVVRRGGVTIAISTSGDAPALTALLREGLEAVLPEDLEAWVVEAREERARWRRSQVPFEQRKPLLLRSLNRLYPSTLHHGGDGGQEERSCSPHDRTSASSAVMADPHAFDRGLTPARERRGDDRDPRVPWLNAPEDSWL